MSAIPRGSGNTKAVSDWLAEFARERGLRYQQDALNNIIIFKDASAGYEGAEPVICRVTWTWCARRRRTAART